MAKNIGILLSHNNHSVSKGIYTLANDKLYDQVIALINSIRRNYSRTIPICIIPYNDEISRLRNLDIDGLFIFDNQNSLNQWDNFASKIWNSQYFADFTKNAWYHGSHTIRKLCSFDGIFEQFIYIDSDELVMSSLEDCFTKLKHYDCVFNDWEHKKQPSFLKTDLIKSKYDYTEQYIKEQCHCSDFFASKSGLLNYEIMNNLKVSLLEDNEISFINNAGWWDEVYLFSYITLVLNWNIFNYTLSKDSRERTGHIAGVNPFYEQDYRLLNLEGLKPVHRIHYMGYSSEKFTRLCRGEDTNLPYQKLFLFYRFIDEPEKAPMNLSQPSLGVKMYRLGQKALLKIKNKIKNS